ncbi:MAG: hypothetical protein E3J21_22990 [Anaerolineales bacterium]|nr:MAG: hypothetical protein E3J21_22990 [Anaerolineales bacterium]
MQIILLVWVIPILLSALFGLLIVRELRIQRGELAAAPTIPAFEEQKESLIFYFEEGEEESVKATVAKDVIIRIPAGAWAEEWREDLLRFEVITKDPNEYPLSPEQLGESWSGELVRAYELRPIRMTELGEDIEITSFEQPVDIIFASEDKEAKLSILQLVNGKWSMPRPTLIPPPFLSSWLDLVEVSWVGITIQGPGYFGLAKQL